VVSEEELSGSVGGGVWKELASIVVRETARKKETAERKETVLYMSQLRNLANKGKGTTLRDRLS
jgi:hypothetical protein